MTNDTAPGLTAWLAGRGDRCDHGYAPEQHPAICGCGTGPASEWALFTAALREAVRDDGSVHQRDVRPRIRGRIEPKHIGQLWRKARDEGLVREAGHERSDDAAGRNAGRMEPYYFLRRCRMTTSRALLIGTQTVNGNGRRPGKPVVLDVAALAAWTAKNEAVRRAYFSRPAEPDDAPTVPCGCGRLFASERSVSGASGADGVRAVSEQWAGADPAERHRQFGAGCTGCDWWSEDFTLSLTEDHRRHVESLRASSSEQTGSPS